MRNAGYPSPARTLGRAVVTPESHWGASVRLVAGRSIAGALAGFHTWLFWVHATTGRLLDPATALRWVAAALILAGFLTLRRVGRPLTSGRQALVLWLLVAMLHGHAMVGAAQGVQAASVPETVSVLLTQIATAAPAVLLGAGLLLLLARRHVDRPRALALAEVRRFSCGTPLSGHVFPFSPRPPPHLLSV
jgi:hypothetical protein